MNTWTNIVVLVEVHESASSLVCNMRLIEESLELFDVAFCAVPFFLQVSALLSIGFLYLARKQTTEKQLVHEHGHPYHQ